MGKRLLFAGLAVLLLPVSDSQCLMRQLFERVRDSVGDDLIRGRAIEELREGMIQDLEQKNAKIREIKVAIQKIKDGNSGIWVRGLKFAGRAGQDLESGDMRCGQDELPRLKVLLEELEQNRDDARDIGRKGLDGMIDVGKMGMQAVLDGVNALDRGEQEVEKAFIAERARTERWRNLGQTINDFFSEPKNIAMIAGGTAGVILSYFAARDFIVPLAKKQAEKYLFTPKIFKEYSWKSWWSQLWDETSEPTLLSDFIAAPALEGKLVDLANDIKNAVANGDFLPHLMFYGPPGTGKTMYAKALAHYSGFHYGIIPGSSLAKLPSSEALAKLNEILDFVRSFNKPTLLFFDEIEAFLPNRETASEETRKLVTEFLSHIEKPMDKKVMIVGATNRPNAVDPAAISRMRPMHIPRPGVEELTRLFGLYVSKLCFEQKIQIEDGLEVVYSKVAELAKAGKMVGRDIEVLCRLDMPKIVRRTGSAVLTKEILLDVVKSFLVEKKEREAFVFE